MAELYASQLRFSLAGFRGMDKLGLRYEANPMSFIVEKAGGASSTTYEQILDIQSEGLHSGCR